MFVNFDNILCFFARKEEVDKIAPDFRHILCPSRVISFCFGIFPCLGLRKWLRTANFAFCRVELIYVP